VVLEPVGGVAALAEPRSIPAKKPVDSPASSMLLEPGVGGGEGHAQLLNANDSRPCVAEGEHSGSRA
jgi:hypothetical protein